MTGAVGRIRSTLPAVERFLAAVGDVPPPDAAPARSPAKRARAAADAREELRRMGV